MTEQDKSEFTKALAELYIKRRQEWWSAVEIVKEMRQKPTSTYPQVVVFQHYQNKVKSTAKWDQLVEVIELLPADFKEAIMLEVARIE
ncbi:MULTISPECIES: hypothetical protein [unclassified Paenibacillus]|uniref:hypothetical protein n=1 Tax=unclassified Paenibacillus TaxID=185978 RepID=UPI0024734C57|nr:MULTISPECIES: hypothetical protein [unclassified Paenibacillus]MDH6427225.1 hypothetical protein [Paenibacillus sp. PastH-4]MDH6443254.1 hypothetical protein [Paenibacillus sp. PastF-4]MDH6526041.1 hypothetical protein [Paenibacillus sp. PastH-3]